MVEDHQNSSQVEIAADWLRCQALPVKGAVPALQARFGLSAVQACEAIALARNLPVRRGNV
jgi:hypothetical protein